jgi:hypothetical protein
VVEMDETALNTDIEVKDKISSRRNPFGSL